MIGDWVHDSENERSFHVDKCLFEYCDDWDRIHPIPLTEEILKANGFVMEEERPCKTYRLWLGDCYEDGFVYIAYHNFDDGQHISLHIEAIPPHVLSTLTIEFTYVHELQHALRLCGLNDLADNFKIK